MHSMKDQLVPQIRFIRRKCYGLDVFSLQNYKSPAKAIRKCHTVGIMSHLTQG